MHPRHSRFNPRSAILPLLLIVTLAWPYQISFADQYSKPRHQFEWEIANDLISVRLFEGQLVVRYIKGLPLDPDKAEWNVRFPGGEVSRKLLDYGLRPEERMYTLRVHLLLIASAALLLLWLQAAVRARRGV